MSALVLTGTGVSIEDVAAVARAGRKVEVAPAVMERLDRARKVLDRAAASGQPIYGLNTGLGANLGTSVSGDASAFQHQLLEGRSGAVGDALSQDIVRATMLARTAMFSAGGSGISSEVFLALIGALNAGVHPVMPSLGSIGDSDLVLMATLGRMLTGDGEADFQGRRMPAAKALAMARLSPVSLAPKDGLSLISASAVSAGSGALHCSPSHNNSRQARLLWKVSAPTRRSSIRACRQRDRPLVSSRLQRACAICWHATRRRRRRPCKTRCRSVACRRSMARCCRQSIRPGKLSRSSSTPPPTTRWCWATTTRCCRPAIFTPRRCRLPSRRSVLPSLNVRPPVLPASSSLPAQAAMACPNICRRSAALRPASCRCKRQ